MGAESCSNTPQPHVDVVQLPSGSRSLCYMWSICIMNFILCCLSSCSQYFHPALTWDLQWLFPQSARSWTFLRHEIFLHLILTTAMLVFNGQEMACSYSCPGFQWLRASGSKPRHLPTGWLNQLQSLCPTALRQWTTSDGPHTTQQDITGKAVELSGPTMVEWVSYLCSIGWLTLQNLSTTSALQSLMSVSWS